MNSQEAFITSTFILQTYFYLFTLFILTTENDDVSIIKKSYVQLPVRRK
ncbi:5856_t:CDS:2, partial [Funneliformis caledonium]